MVSYNLKTCPTMSFRRAQPTIQGPGDERQENVQWTFLGKEPGCGRVQPAPNLIRRDQYDRSVVREAHLVKEI